MYMYTQNPRHTNIVNLTNFELTLAMRSLLSKGLSSVPRTWPKKPSANLSMDLIDTLRVRHTSKYVSKAPHRASTPLKHALTSIQYDFGSLSTARVTASLIRGEKSALSKLVKYIIEDLVICKADKDNLTVIMTTSHVQCLDLA